MADAGNVARQWLDLLTRYPEFDDVPGKPLCSGEDVEQVERLFDGWYYKWSKQKEHTWPHENVIHRLQYLRTKYIELLTNGDTRPRTKRHVERISTVCRILHELKRQGLDVYMTDGSDIYSNRGHEDDIDNTLNRVENDSDLEIVDDGVAKEKEPIGGCTTAAE